MLTSRDWLAHPMSQPAAKLAAPEPFRCCRTKDAAMNTTLDLFADTLPAVHEARGTDRTAFELGWDYAHYRLTPPPEALTEGHPVRQGWQAGGAVFGSRTLKPTPPVRKWLQLRFSAWRRGRAFEGTQVTPNFLAQIDVPLCPITRSALTHASGAGSDASVDRVCNAAGYAAGNLAVMSARANEAKADLIVPRRAHRRQTARSLGPGHARRTVRAAMVAPGRADELCHADEAR